MKSFQAQTHYEVLEISVGATLAEIRGAHDRLVTLYSDDQVALYGLIDPGRAAALRARLDEALEVLTDEQRRDAYDLKIGLPPRVVAKPPPPPPRPAAPQAAASVGTGWGGAIAWVTPTAPAQPTSQPSAYTWAVTPTKPVAAPPPVLVVPVPARILAEPPPAPALEPEPRQLALDVTPGVPSWGHREPPAPLPPPAPAAVEVAPPPPAPPPLPTPPPPLPAPPPPLPAQPPPPVEEVPDVIQPPKESTPAPVLFQPAAPAPAPVVSEPEKPLAEEPPLPVLGDDVQVAIVPARATPSRDFKVEQRPRPYEIPEGVEINGDLLKQVRLAKGLSLAQLADRTRIGAKHLENVEGDRYDALPAPVYLRGILMSLARELGLDGLRVSKSYLTFVEAHRSKG